MKFFGGQDVTQYTREFYGRMKDEIQGFTDAQIMGCDFEEWADYFAEKYYIAPIELVESAIKKTMSEIKVEKYNIWSRNDPYEPMTIKVDGYRIVFEISFDGDAHLLELQPSHRILIDFTVNDMKAPRGENYGYFSLSFEYTVQELKNKGDSMETYVQQNFEKTFKNYKEMIDHVNAEIAGYNQSIKDNARNLLTERHKRANDYAMVSQALKIPLSISLNAPNITPIPLKRVAKKLPERPKQRQIQPEYCISDFDYKNIVNIIHNTCAAMEATSRTFSKNDEEELRDFILATLGTHYENTVTGETFRKIGKTDIHIVFDNKAAFIGECKIWHGIKKFDDAVKQLFGYSTWKDTKTALIVFDKDVKDFTSIRRNVLKWIEENTKQYTELNSNIWNCVIHRDDTNVDVSVAIALYDLTV